MQSLCKQYVTMHMRTSGMWKRKAKKIEQNKWIYKYKKELTL